MTPEPRIITTAGGDEIDLARIGGSDAATIVGLSPWATEHGLWRRIVHGDATEGTERMRWGSLLESTIIDEACERMRCGSTPADSIAPPHPAWLRATPDARLCGTDAVAGCLLEAKATSARAEVDWRVGIPSHYAAQAQWTMGAEARWGEHGTPPAMIFAVLFGGAALRLYRLAYDADVAEVLLDEARLWWTRHIVGGEEPDRVDHPPMAHQPERDERREIRAAGKVDMVDMETLVRVEERIKDLMQTKGNLRRKLLVSIGDDRGIESPVGRVMARNVAVKTTVRWSAVVDDLRVHVDAGIVADVTARHTTEGPGYRSLTASWRKE